MPSTTSPSKKCSNQDNHNFFGGISVKRMSAYVTGKRSLPDSIEIESKSEGMMVFRCTECDKKIVFESDMVK